MTIAIEKAEAVSASVLAALHAESFGEPWDTAAFARLLAMPGTFALLALDGETPCGMVLMRCAADEAEVLTIAASPAVRGKGVGRCLLEAGMAEAAARGARRFFLEVAETNAPARALYARAGFRLAGERPGYYRQNGAFVTALTLSLET